MKRARLVLPAVLLGTAAAVAVATSSGDREPDPERAGMVTAAPPAVPLTPVGAPRRQDPSPPVGDDLPLGKGGARAIPGTVGVAARGEDPTGGPPWVVRTWQRRGGKGGRVWCTQLGREVDGQFVWLLPGAREAGRVLPRESETTVCATTAPISQRLGVMVASFADRDQRDPAARIAATVIWGVVDQRVDAARFEHDGRSYPVAPQRHGVLKVLPGSEPASLTTLVVRDIDGGRREAIPPAFFDLTGQRSRTWISTPTVAAPGELRPLLRTAPRPGGIQVGIFWRPPRPGFPACFTSPTPMIAGRAGAALDRRTGLLRQTQQPCNPLPPRAEFEPTGLSGGWTSGDPLPAGTREADEAERRRNERRIQYGSGGVLMALPRGATLVEVRSPVGVKTVRANRQRIAWVGWEGQPEVQRAMFPPFPGSAAWEREIRTGHTPVSFRALDARGRQVGPTTYMGQMDSSPEAVRKGRRMGRAIALTPAELERRSVRRRLADRP